MDPTNTYGQIVICTQSLASLSRSSDYVRLNPIEKVPSQMKNVPLEEDRCPLQKKSFASTIVGIRVERRCIVRISLMPKMLHF